MKVPSHVLITCRTTLMG